jgi:hypothetical protein
MSRLMRLMVPSRVMPALLTRISIGPWSEMMCPTAASQAAKSPASNFMVAMPVAPLKASAAATLPA